MALDTTSEEVIAGLKAVSNSRKLEQVVMLFGTEKLGAKQSDIKITNKLDSARVVFLIDALLDSTKPGYRGLWGLGYMKEDKLHLLLREGLKLSYGLCCNY